MIFGPIVLIASRSDWSKPRIIAVIPTIDVMPITTPSTVSAERSLLVRTVSKAIATTSVKRLARIVVAPRRHSFRHSFLRASMGSRRAAREAG